MRTTERPVPSSGDVPSGWSFVPAAPISSRAPDGSDSTTSRSGFSSQSTVLVAQPAPRSAAPAARATASEPRRRRGRALVVVALLGFLAAPGCAMGQAMMPPPVKPGYEYVVGPDDVLAVSVWGEGDELAREVTVSPDGEIELPLVGTVVVLDRTIPQVRELVTAGLSKYIEVPLVTVELRQSRSAQVQILGEVGRQGALPYRDRMSLVQALGLSGGVDWRTAKTEDVRVIRGALDDPTLIPIDLDHVLAAAEKDLFLQPGDIVLVPPKYVTVVDRYLSQLFAPLGIVSGTFGNAVSVAAVAGN